MRLLNAALRRLQPQKYAQPPKTVNVPALLMCGLGLLFYCYEYYLRVAPSVMADQLRQSFGLGEAAFGHLAACYYYAYTPMQIPVGVMIDRFGLRRILAIACLACAMGTYLLAETPYFFMAQVGRFLVGFGSAFAYVGVLKLSDLWLPRKYFALMAGIATTLGMVGASGGQMLMTALVERYDWRNTLEYGAAAGVLLTLLLWCCLRDKKEPAPIAASRAALHDSAFLPLDSLKEIMRSRQIWINGTIGCLTFLPLSGFAETWTVSFLRALEFSKEEAALGSSMLFFGFACGGPLWGLISEKMRSRRLPLIFGSFVSAIFMAWVIFMPMASVHGMYALLFAASFFASAEILVFAVSNDIVRSSVSATAASFTNMITMIGGMVLPPLIGRLLDRSLAVDQVLSMQDYAYALAALPIALMVAGALSVVQKESYPKA